MLIMIFAYRRWPGQYQVQDLKIVGGGGGGGGRWEDSLEPRRPEPICHGRDLDWSPKPLSDPKGFR